MMLSARKRWYPGASRQYSRQRGFSLLEMVVALVILSISLVMLYKAAAGATRNVRVDERYAYAVQLAESLLAEYPSVPAGGVADGGEVQEYYWRRGSQPLQEEMQGPGMGEGQSGVSLQQLAVEVRWAEGAGERNVTLVTVVPERRADAQG